MLWNGTKNVEKSKMMRISRQPFPIQILIDQKQQENMKIFTNYETCICKIKYSSAMKTAA